MSIVYSTPISPHTSDMPESCRSTSTCSASSASPPTLPGHEDLSAKIVDAEGPAPYPTHSLSHHYHHHQDALKKSKGEDAFAVAIPCIW